MSETTRMSSVGHFPASPVNMWNGERRRATAHSVRRESWIGCGDRPRRRDEGQFPGAEVRRGGELMAEDAPTRRLTVLAVDDELPALSELEFLLQGTPGIESVTAANSSADALQHLRETTFDAIFPDIRMPGLSGLDLAELVQRFPNPPAIIFVTAHESHAATAFDLAAVDYLRKPLRPERLAEAVTRVQARSVDAAEGVKTPVEDADETIAIELGGTTRFVRRSEVIYAETRGDYVRLHTRDGAHLVRLSLGALEQRWADSGFVRAPPIPGQPRLCGGLALERGARLGTTRRRQTPCPSAGDTPPWSGMLSTSPTVDPEVNVNSSLPPQPVSRVAREGSWSPDHAVMCAAPRLAPLRPRNRGADPVGEVYVRELIRSQLRLGLTTVAIVVLPLFGLLVAFAAWPSLGRLLVGPIPVWWLLLGVAVYPAILGVGWWYARQAERNEERFTAIMDDE